MGDDAKKDGGAGTIYGGVVPPKLPPSSPAKAGQPGKVTPAPPAEPPAKSGSSADPAVAPAQPRPPAVTPSPPLAETPTSTSTGSVVAAPMVPPVLPKGERLVPPSSASGTPAPQLKPPATRLSSGEEDEGKTILIAAKPAGAVIELQRVQPPGHAGTERLDRSVYVLGRSRECSIRLFSESASRRHGQIEQRPDGWYLIPLEDKHVLVDGDVLRGAVRLRHKMRLRFGDDELVVFDPGAQAELGTRQLPEAERIHPPVRRLWLIAAAGAALLVATLAAWWLLGR